MVVLCRIRRRRSRSGVLLGPTPPRAAARRHQTRIGRGRPSARPPRRRAARVPRRRGPARRANRAVTRRRRGAYARREPGRGGHPAPRLAVARGHRRLGEQRDRRRASSTSMRRRRASRGEGRRQTHSPSTGDAARPPVGRSAAAGGVARSGGGGAATDGAAASVASALSLVACRPSAAVGSVVGASDRTASAMPPPQPPAQEMAHPACEASYHPFPAAAAAVLARQSAPMPTPPLAATAPSSLLRPRRRRRPFATFGRLCRRRWQRRQGGRGWSHARGTVFDRRDELLVIRFVGSCRRLQRLRLGSGRRRLPAPRQRPPLRPWPQLPARRRSSLLP